MSNIEIGKYGEDLACEFLIKNKYKIIDRNYKFSRYGEVDIIALDKDELCFIEVKTRRTNTFGTPMEAVTKDKLLKIFKCIKNYTSKTNLKYNKTRIDVISIEIKNNEPKITHLKNIEL